MQINWLTGFLACSFLLSVSHKTASSSFWWIFSVAIYVFRWCSSFLSQELVVDEEHRVFSKVFCLDASLVTNVTAWRGEQVLSTFPDWIRFLGKLSGDRRLHHHSFPKLIVVSSNHFDAVGCDGLNCEERWSCSLRRATKRTFRCME